MRCNSCQRKYKTGGEGLSELGAGWKLGVPQKALGARLFGVEAFGSRAVAWKERGALERN
jgi:hypothetical protein